ncbi:PAS domain-containing hybrid sensor histidine kinase/response regulator [Planctomicrobium piriforme]|uniref:histidine kinase n=1 Tax=Planctomicrobium piriforme TaxID=1576369 RepID=A0A1I3ST95_9PLAN|nr:PAS domain-containing hybrid sensor histidine kinase/response regulator [Planctomicrobium piriforme]SFJ60801.1 PAS domain S-box-containing protein [Planctomicrobium piriforme]
MIQDPRERRLLAQDEQRVYRWTDRMFAWLLITQWLLGIAYACFWTPATWDGSSSAVHPHVYAAIFLGAAIISVPLWLIRSQSGSAVTRHAVAAGQMLSSALLIDLTGGHIESHFHVFGSLAFLSFYRDWKVLVTATLVVIADHVLRGIYFPMSIYGVSSGVEWKWLEHTGWVLFLDAVLAYGCLRSRREMSIIAERQAELEKVNAAIEQTVQERTAQIQAAEQRFQKLAARAPAGIYETDRLGNMIYVNDCILEITGLTLPPQNFAEWMNKVHAEDLARVRAAWSQSLETGREFQVEYRCLTGSGELRWVFNNAVPLLDETDEITGYLGTIIDLTEQRRRDEVEYENQQRLRRAFDDAAVGMSLVAPDGRWLQVNRALCDITGYSAEELLSMQFQHLRHPDDIASDAAALQEMATGGTDVYAAETRLRHRDGHYLWIYASAQVIRGRSGEPRYLVCQSIDITDRKTADEQLRQAHEELGRLRDEAVQASRSKSEFLANMSHEIRTPMNGVLGMTEVVLDSELTRDQRESLEIVKSSAESLLVVLDDILDFSKIEAGRMELDPIDFDLHELVETTLKSLALRAHRKGLELNAEIAANVPHNVVGDPHRIRQVLVNLVGNAIKFTETGEVLVRLEAVELHGRFQIAMTVEDTGIGIPFDKQAVIFSPFAQADGSTTRRFGGTGLGLTISSQLVTLMGGRIDIDSEPGRGSRFRVEITLTAGSEGSTGFQQLPSFGGLNILVVDDNATNRRIFECLLRQWGAAPTCVESAHAALDELHLAMQFGRPYPLLLVDAGMPEVDGFMLVERLHQEATLSMPVIMMLTSCDQQGDAARCRELGMASYLIKPVRAAELRRAIAAALKIQGTPRVRTTAVVAPIVNVVPAAIGSLRVLVAEDHSVNQWVAQRLLSRLGATATIVNTGRDAVEACREHPPDVVLMDIQMPELDGLAATREIRANEHGTDRHIRIIGVTAHALKGDRERCLAAGMDDYLAKPIRLHELQRVLWTCTQCDVTAKADRTEQLNGSPALIPGVRSQRSHSEAELQRELNSLFLAGIPRQLAELQTAARDGEFTQLARGAHRLRGALGNLASDGAETTAQTALKIEECAIKRDHPAILTTLTELESQIARLAKELATDSGPETQRI